ncbi:MULTISPECIES: amidohydrolase family protein [unclassified Sphingopyxis]|uniref:amidohydrolase family protein n=1 Tax=unclassified Sphingopyxis TaxID=2614943 RepID=UPI000730173F|nr:MULTISPECIES: amidohydrolase family protein [unclassified Sphingopyxis]KTE24196.1 amidohydrolase [Sphingopyxis sp. H057]KTE50493.1 amidohydrolase [Sphingopyxis sp. H073]KTE52582.1 amidohydrolase [Sphingopyxis sp. H071]KTE63075.1 amidohydrolase [Sphingopyxis sp. H107]KTE64964.1 amidohydrolase [Sphingopyxis sp. H100]
MARFALAFTAALACSTSAWAQSAPADAKPEKWDVNAPPGMTTHKVPIAVDEGSWMNVDVAPDGRTIAFDLLGDIYTMSIEGGTPTRIAEGLAYEHQPRFSPDGNRIAFVSDRGGGDNIWLMNRDGSDKRQLSKEEFRLLNQPSWSPDGQFIVAKKHFTTGRSLGTGEVWMYHVSGGAGVPLVKKPNERHQKELGEPIFAPDGKGVYYTRNVTPGPIFEYAQDSNGDLFHIERYDLNDGEVTTVAAGPGGAVRPSPSPDGKKLAYVRREGTQSKLYVKDLASGAEKKLYDALDQDVQETWAVTGVYPNMSWTPDSRDIVFWAGGKLRRVNSTGGDARIIPFTIDDDRVIIDATHPAVEVAPDSFETKMPRWAEVSPDGSTVVFETLGKLWLKPAAGGTARRLTAAKDNAFELWPSWSRDGKSVVFVRWTDAGLGEIHIAGRGGGSSRKITASPGHYAEPRFSPDGKLIAFEKRSGGGLRSERWGDNPGIYRIAVSGGAAERVSDNGAKPQFGAASDRIFMIASADGKNQLISTDLHGQDRRVHASGELVSDYEVSPDGRTLAFRQNYDAYVTPLMPGGQDVSLSTSGGAMPVTRVSGSGADYVHWSDGGKRLHWTRGPTLFSADLGSFFASAPAAGEDKPAKFVPPTSGVSLAMTAPVAKHKGTVVITGAKILTMAGADGGIIDNGAIVIEGDRIAAVGAAGAIAVPAGAVTVDASGKTIVPGFVDAHAHGPHGDDELVPQQNWSEIVNLAMGTTTSHNPSSRASEIFVSSEMQRAGLILAPRIFSTGEIIYGAKAAGIYAEINGYEDALAHVRRLKAQGAHSVKNYNQPRREQRQMVVKAAQAEGMEVVPEGGSLYTMDVTLIQDGNSTVEHNIPLHTFYKDLVQLWGQTRTDYTPTLVVTYGGPAGDPYWRAHTNVWEQPILSRHAPPAELAANNKRRVIAPEGDYVDDDSAREAKKIADTGRMVSIGAHGQQAGLGAHWEIWSFVRGGWSNIDALRAATIMPATSLGYAKDVGSLEVGKLADLLILDADPTQDIRNTEKIHRVMLGGRLYDPLTMDEVGTGTRKRQPYWWEAERP